MISLRGTSARIRKIIGGSRKAVDAVEIRAALEDAVDKSTVYRALKQLEARGLINSLRFPDGRKYYFSGDRNGHFLMCDNCHEVIEFSDCNAAAVEETVGVRYGYDVNGHILIITGLCPDCIKVKNKKRGGGV